MIERQANARRVQRLVVALALLVGSARAQEPGPGDTVASRGRPEVDGVEHRLGAFVLSSTITLSTEIDDNIFAERQDAAEDRVERLEPALALASNWSKHALRLGGDVTAVRYGDHRAEDHENDSLWLDARLDVRDSSSLTAALRRDRSHEGRDSPDDAGGDVPTRFATESTRLSYSNHRTRVGFDLNAERLTLDFDDSFRSADATRINNDDRDRRDVRATARIGYRLGPNYGIFFQASSNSRSYVQRFDDNGFQRSSNGTEYAVGFSMDRGVVFGDFFVGHRSQEFDDPRFSTIEDSSFGGELTWNLTRLTTLTASVRRSVDNTTIVGVSGIDATRLALAADHELRRNVIVSLSFDERTEDFKGAERTDDIAGAALTCRYFMNRRLHVVGGYRRESRGSTRTGPAAFEYSRSVYFVRLQGYL